MRYAAFAFPSGFAAAGLAALRVSIAAFLVTSAMAHPFPLAWLQPVPYVVAAAVLAGFQARIAAGLAAAVALSLAFRQSWTAPVATHTLDAAALATLGPGALSIDAYRFGRRTLRLPR